MVTITTSDSIDILPGETVTIAGAAVAGYNGAFEVATVDPANDIFTYVDSINNGPAKLNLPPDAGGSTEFITTAATTIYNAATPNGNVWLNAQDGTFAYTPNPGFTGTDSFTYQAVDAASNTPSANTTVTLFVGGDLYIPQTGIGSNTTKIGSQIVVPVNILDPNPSNSGGLGNVTIGINYDPAVFDPNNITVNEGSVNTAAGWTQFTSNTNTPGQIVITTSDTGGATPIYTSVGGSLAFITFNVIGLPTSAAGTTVINLSAVVPRPSQIDTLPANVPNALPMAFAAADNTNFNGSPGPDDGLVALAPRTPLAYNASANPGVTAYTLRYDAASGNVELINSANTASILASAAPGNTSAITITGHSGGSDTLTIDYSGGYFTVPGGISFNGGGAGTLNIQGGSFLTTTDNASGPGAGTLVLHPNTDPDTTVTYSGLAPINISSSLGNVIMNLPANAPDAVLKGSANAGMETITATANSFESLNFNNPTGTLTINGAAGGTHKLIVQSLNPSFDANLAINLKGSSDDVDFDKPLDLPGHKTINVAAKTINFNAAVSAGSVQTSATTLNINTTAVATSQALVPPR